MKISNILASVFALAILAFGAVGFGVYANAATTTADAALATTPQPFFGGGVGNYKQFSISIPSTLTSGDVFQLARVPKNATVLDVYVQMPDVDSGSSITLDLGYGDNTNAFAAASTTGRTGGVIRSSSVEAAPITFTTSDTIDLVVNAAPATGVAGTATGWVLYTAP